MSVCDNSASHLTLLSGFVCVFQALNASILKPFSAEEHLGKTHSGWYSAESLPAFESHQKTQKTRTFKPEGPMTGRTRIRRTFSSNREKTKSWSLIGHKHIMSCANHVQICTFDWAIFASFSPCSPVAGGGWMWLALTNIYLTTVFEGRENMTNKSKVNNRLPLPPRLICSCLWLEMLQ